MLSPTPKPPAAGRPLGVGGEHHRRAQRRAERGERVGAELLDHRRRGQVQRRAGAVRAGHRGRLHDPLRVGGAQQRVAGHEQPVGALEPRARAHLVEPAQVARVGGHRPGAAVDQRDHRAGAAGRGAPHLDPAPGQGRLDEVSGAAVGARAEHPRPAAEGDHPGGHVGGLATGGERDPGRGVVVGDQRAGRLDDDVEQHVSQAGDQHSLGLPMRRRGVPRRAESPHDDQGSCTVTRPQRRGVRRYCIRSRRRRPGVHDHQPRPAHRDERPHRPRDRGRGTARRGGPGDDRRRRRRGAGRAVRRRAGAGRGGGRRRQDQRPGPRAGAGQAPHRRDDRRRHVVRRAPGRHPGVRHRRTRRGAPRGPGHLGRVRRPGRAGRRPRHGRVRRREVDPGHRRHAGAARVAVGARAGLRHRRAAGLLCPRRRAAGAVAGRLRRRGGGDHAGAGRAAPAAGDRRRPTGGGRGRDGPRPPRPHARGRAGRGRAAWRGRQGRHAVPAGVVPRAHGRGQPGRQRGAGAGERRAGRGDRRGQLQPTREASAPDRERLTARGRS